MLIEILLLVGYLPYTHVLEDTTREEILGKKLKRKTVGKKSDWKYQSTDPCKIETMLKEKT
jgi:hypothetical protein